MAHPTPERWRRIESLYHAAAEREPDQRAAFLAAACDGDESLRGEVELLLTQPMPSTALLRGAAGRRIGSYELRGLLADRVWIVPSEFSTMATPANTRTITLPAGTLDGRMSGWSADGRLLYSLLVLDGFRCLYAQRIDPSGREAPGEPFAVHHFHDPRRAWGSTPASNAVTARGFVFDQLDTSSSIWLLAHTAAR
jgi:hypothetical protein